MESTETDEGIKKFKYCFGDDLPPGVPVENVLSAAIAAGCLEDHDHKSPCYLWPSGAALKVMKDHWHSMHREAIPFSGEHVVYIFEPGQGVPHEIKIRWVVSPSFDVDLDVLKKEGFFEWD